MAECLPPQGNHKQVPDHLEAPARLVDSLVIQPGCEIDISRLRIRLTGLLDLLACAGNDETGKNIFSRLDKGYGKTTNKT